MEELLAAGMSAIFAIVKAIEDARAGTVSSTDALMRIESAKAILSVTSFASNDAKVDAEVAAEKKP